MHSDEINNAFARLILHSDSESGNCFRQSGALVCIDRSIGHWITANRLDDLLSVLALPDKIFAETFPTLAHVNIQQRQQFLIEVENHVGICLYCQDCLRSFMHDFHSRLKADRINQGLIKAPLDKAKRSSHLFLCHSSVDKVFVRKLASNLTELGVRVWFDEWELKIGDSLHDCIDVALSTSSFVAVVISPSSMNSRWCKEELNAALSKEIQSGLKIVLPLLYRGVVLPTFLADRFHLDFRRRYLPALAKLAVFIHHLDQRELGKLLSQTKLKSLGETRDLLFRLGWQNTTRVYVPRGEFEVMIEILKRAGANIDCEEFQLKERLDDGGYGHMISVKA